VVIFLDHDVDPMLIYGCACIGMLDSVKEPAYACPWHQLVIQISCNNRCTSPVLFSFKNCCLHVLIMSGECEAYANEKE
jgi:hypothetical protein